MAAFEPVGEEIEIALGAADRGGVFGRGQWKALPRVCFTQQSEILARSEFSLSFPNFEGFTGDHYLVDSG